MCAWVCLTMHRKKTKNDLDFVFVKCFVVCGVEMPLTWLWRRRSSFEPLTDGWSDESKTNLNGLVHPIDSTKKVPQNNSIWDFHLTMCCWQTIRWFRSRNCIIVSIKLDIWMEFNRFEHTKYCSIHIQRKISRNWMVCFWTQKAFNDCFQPARSKLNSFQFRFISFAIDAVHTSSATAFIHAKSHTHTHTAAMVYCFHFRN